MGTCYSANKIETSNSSFKRPYDKSIQSKTDCHQIINTSYLATISNNKLLTLNNQSYDLLPKVNSVNLNSLFNTDENNLLRTSNQIDMSKNQTELGTKNKLVSKLPRFGASRQIQDSSKNLVNQLNSKTINHDVLRIKNGFLNVTSKNPKSSNSSLSNSETSCTSSVSTNSVSSNVSNTNEINSKKLIFKKINLTLSDNVINKNVKKNTKELNTEKIANAQSLKNFNQFNDKLKSRKNELVKTNEIKDIQNIYTSNAAKLPTSKYSTTISNLPRPQTAQRISTKNWQQVQTINRFDSNKDKFLTFNKLYTNVQDSQKVVRSYTFKQTTDIYQPYKRPQKSNCFGPITNANNLNFPYSETTLKSKFDSNNENKNPQLYLPKSSFSLITKKNNFSEIPFKKSTPVKVIKDENYDLNFKKNSIHKPSLLTNNQSSNFYKNNVNGKKCFECLNSKSLPVGADKKNNLNSILNCDNLSKSCETPNTYLKNENSLDEIDFVSQKPKFPEPALFRPNNEKINKNENKVNGNDVNNSFNCENSQNNSLKNSLSNTDTSDLSSTKISPEHNRTDFLIDDEICDQPDLLFLNSKEDLCTKNRTETTNELKNKDENTDLNNLLKSTIRYRISELDSLKLKQELLMSSTLQVDQNEKIEENLSQNKISQNNITTDNYKNLTLQNNLSPVKTFRKPRPLSVVESNGSLALDGSSFRSVMQDINGIKTLLFRLQGEVQNSETQNPFENVLNCKSPDKTKKEKNFSNENKNLETENFELKQQISVLQQQLDEKDRTIRLLQQQMTKYLNINENELKQTANAVTQTERNSFFQIPKSTATEDGIVVRSNDKSALC